MSIAAGEHSPRSPVAGSVRRESEASRAHCRAGDPVSADGIVIRIMAPTAADSCVATATAAETVTFVVGAAPHLAYHVPNPSRARVPAPMLMASVSRLFPSFAGAVLLAALAPAAVSASEKRPAKPAEAVALLDRAEEECEVAPAAAELLLLEADPLLEALDEPELRARWHVLYATSLLYRARHDEAIMHFRRALDGRRGAEGSHAYIDALERLGFLHITRREFAPAAEVLTEALTLARQWGTTRHRTYVPVRMGLLLLELGDQEGAFPHLREALHTAEASGDEDLLSFARYHIAIAYYRSGRLERARGWYEQALSHERTSGRVQSSAMAMLRVAQIDTLEQRPERAIERLREALELARTGEFVREQGLIHLGMVQPLIATGDPVDAERHAALAGKLLQRTGNRMSVARALAAEGQALHRADEHESAIDRLERAIAEFAALERLGEVAAARRQLAAVLAETGRHRDAYLAARRANEELGRFHEDRADETLQKLQIAFAVERQNAENRLLEEQHAADAARLKAQERWLQLQWAVVLLLLVLLAFVAVTFLRQRQFQKKLYSLANTDPLTNVANRRAVLEFGRKQLIQCQRMNIPLAIIAIDVDDFKAINDRYGHEAGDRVLQKLTAVLAGGLRSGDMLGRIGGEEFLAVLPGADAEQAAVIAERLRQELAAHNFSEIEESLSITSSFGIASLVDEKHRFSDMLRMADRRLYRAKEAGRNCVVYAPALDTTGVYG